MQKKCTYGDSINKSVHFFVLKESISLKTTENNRKKQFLSKTSLVNYNFRHSIIIYP
ncbi:hypothetical protein D3C80_1239700 [compost metagenome]